MWSVRHLCSVGSRTGRAGGPFPGRIRSERCRVGLGRLAQLPCAGALQGLDCVRQIDVDEGIELLWQTGGEPVALAFALRAIDDAVRQGPGRVSARVLSPRERRAIAAARADDHAGPAGPAPPWRVWSARWDLPCGQFPGSDSGVPALCSVAGGVPGVVDDRSVSDAVVDWSGVEVALCPLVGSELASPASGDEVEP